MLNYMIFPEGMTAVTDGEKTLAEYVYSASGNPVVKKIGGNITSTYAYDELLNIKALKTETEKQTLADNHYFYDGNGNQIRREGLEGTTGYTYDERNRLTEISYPSALGGYTEKLSYDAAGNRIRRETEQEITTYRYDNCNRLQELRREYKNAETSTAQPEMIRYTYDRQGNMLREKSMKSGEEKKYSYDSFGRMVRAEVPVEHRGASNKPDEHAGFNHAAQSTGETFGIQENSSATREFQVQINRYDGEGLRHEMEENGRLIKFLYNEDREVVAEETSNGTITRYIRGLGIISTVRQMRQGHMKRLREKIRLRKMLVRVVVTLIHHYLCNKQIKTWTDRKDNAINMNTATSDLSSATNVYWTKKWYQFWRKTIKIVED